MADLPAEILAKDRRIDELVDQADRLIADLGVITAALKERLKSAQGDVDQQKEITAKDRTPDG